MVGSGIVNPQNSGNLIPTPKHFAISVYHNVTNILLVERYSVPNPIKNRKKLNDAFLRLTKHPVKKP